MANTFLLAMGRPIGRSLAEPDKQTEARRVTDEIEADGKELLLPLDVVAAPSADAEGASAARSTTWMRSPATSRSWTSDRAPSSATRA